jgi:hypothetical protein
MNKFSRTLIAGLWILQANVALGDQNILNLPLTKNAACKAYWSMKVDSIRFQNSVKNRVWNFVVVPFGLAAVQPFLPVGTFMRGSINFGLFFGFSYLSDRAIDFVDRHFYSLHEPIDGALKVATMGDALQKKAVEECDLQFPQS